MFQLCVIERVHVRIMLIIVATHKRQGALSIACSYKYESTDLLEIHEQIRGFRFEDSDSSEIRFEPSKILEPRFMATLIYSFLWNNNLLIKIKIFF